MLFASKYSKIILFSLIIALSFLMVAQTGTAGDAQTGVQKAEEGLNKTAEGGFGPEATKTATLPETIGRIVGAALSFLGVAFFVLMIYGGYMWMFSMGNEQTAGKAKEIIIAAVIGLAVVLMAYAITSFLGTVVAPGTPAS